MPAPEPMPIADAVRWACVLEVSAPKAGNVHRGASFHDATWRDFITSAEAIAPVLAEAPSRGVGRTILDAVTATQRRTGTNTNLGIILLLAPMCAAPRDEPLAQGIERVLAALTVEDATLAFEAIRAAKPGGLGDARQGDVRSAPTVTLLEAMRLAADRDGIARQYASGFADVLGPIACDLAGDDLPLLLLRIVRAHLRQMARRADTLIARKCGPALAQESADRARAVLDAGWPDAPGASEAFAAFDAWLRADGNRRNPGTSADLIAAGLFALLREGRLGPPFEGLESES